MIYTKFCEHALIFCFLVLVLLAGINRSEARPIYDFDGDGRADFAVIRFSGDNTQFTWFILQSRDGFGVKYWGYQYPTGSGLIDNDTSGDFDGDGKWDVAVRRGGSSMPNILWYVLNSHDASMTAQQWGLAGDQLVPQDYDGDGKTDFAVYRAGWWYILRSSDGQFQAEKFGLDTDNPFQGGDYDGDGKDDISVLRLDGGWRQWIRLSSTGWWKKYDLGNPQFTGVFTGDFDGDGKSDVAIWQGNLWLWERSSDGQLGGGLRFGDPGNDRPVPADYDGDGKTDIAVFRNSFQKYFYVLRSRDGFLAMPWGGGGNADANLFDRRYMRPVGFRPAEANGQPFKDNGPFPRLVEIRKN